MPNHPHKRTDETAKIVEEMASVGFGQQEIGAAIGISHVTLRKHYRAELDTSATRANAKVAMRLFETAMGANDAPWPQSTAAMIFWCKTRLGWKETSSHELSGPDGGPIETGVGALSEAQLIRELERRGLPAQVFEE